jgi:hypothetical protein
MMVGRSPFFHGHCSTVFNTMMVPPASVSAAQTIGEGVRFVLRELYFMSECVAAPCALVFAFSAEWAICPDVRHLYHHTQAWPEIL